MRAWKSTGSAKSHGPMRRNVTGQVLRAPRGIFRGLRFLHSLKWVHADISVDNVLECPTTGAVKLIDFGAAGKVTAAPPSSLGVRTHRLWFLFPQSFAQLRQWLPDSHQKLKFQVLRRVLVVSSQSLLS